MKKIIFGLAILLPLTTVNCTSTPLKNTVPTRATPLSAPNKNQGYIITTTVTADDKIIRKIYADYGVIWLRALGNHQYELRLQNDPGLDEMLHVSAHSGSGITAVQPNYSYSIN